MEKFLPDSTLSLAEFIKKYTSDPDFGESPEVIAYLTIRWNYFFNTAEQSQYEFKDVVAAWKKTHFFYHQSNKPRHPEDGISTYETFEIQQINSTKNMESR